MSDTFDILECPLCNHKLGNELRPVDWQVICVNCKFTWSLLPKDEVSVLRSTITSLQSRLEESEAVIGQLNVFLNSERSTVKLYKSRLEAAEGENGRLIVVEQELEAEKRFISSLRTQLIAAESRAQPAEEMAGRAAELAQKAFDAAIDMAAEHCLRIGDYSAQSRADGIRDEAHEEWEAFKKEHLSTSPPSDRTDGERLELPKFLLDMAQQIRTQDNLATSHPLYCVFVKERVYGIDMNFEPQYAWIDQTSGDYIEATDEEAKQLEAMDAAGEATRLEGCEYEKTGFVEKERFITASLTRAGAEEHLRLNGHNLPGAYIYVTSLYRTPDMIQLREWVASLPVAENEGRVGA